VIVVATGRKRLIEDDEGMEEFRKIKFNKGVY